MREPSSGRRRRLSAGPPPRPRPQARADPGPRRSGAPEPAVASAGTGRRNGGTGVDARAGPGSRLCRRVRSVSPQAGPRAAAARTDQRPREPASQIPGCGSGRPRAARRRGAHRGYDHTNRERDGRRRLVRAQRARNRARRERGQPGGTPRNAGRSVAGGERGPDRGRAGPVRAPEPGRGEFCPKTHAWIRGARLDRFGLGRAASHPGRDAAPRRPGPASRSGPRVPDPRGAPVWRTCARSAPAGCARTPGDRGVGPAAGRTGRLGRGT